MSKKIIGATVGTTININNLTQAVMAVVEEHTSSVAGKISTVEAIAKGRNTGYVFDEEKDMTNWLSLSSDLRFIDYSSGKPYYKTSEDGGFVFTGENMALVIDDFDGFASLPWGDWDIDPHGFKYWLTSKNLYYILNDDGSELMKMEEQPSHNQITRLKQVDLQLGDNLYIRYTGVPDYWWDGSAPRELETQFVNVDQYAKIEDLDSKADEWDGVDGGYYTVRARCKTTTGNLTNYLKVYSSPLAYAIPTYTKDKQLSTETPTDALHCANKKYVDALVGDIETAIDAAIALCDSYIDGGAK